MKLLSIAIPTFNRSNLLEKALGRIIPQIIPYRDEIELIVSNNGSTDRTSAVIDHCRERYPIVDFIVNTNKENVGIACNYKICRSLSCGKYLWILSDDDFVNEGIIREIVLAVREPDVAIVFLDTWSRADGFCREKLPFETFIKKVKNKFTLVSSSIYFNEKTNDDRYVHRFLSNSFLCFWYTVNALEHSRNVVRVSGKSLAVKNEASHSYNAIKAFSIEILDVLNYMRMKGFITRVSMRVFLGDLMRFQLFQSLVGYKLANRAISYSDIFRMELMSYRSFWLYVLPVSVLPSAVLKLMIHLVRRIRCRL